MIGKHLSSIEERQAHQQGMVPAAKIPQGCQALLPRHQADRPHTCPQQGRHIRQSMSSAV